MSNATSRDIVGQILRALAERGQSATAADAEISETRLSRWKSDDRQGGLDLTETARVLAALNLRIVPAGPDSIVPIPRETYDALHVLLRDYADGVVRGRVA